MYGLKFICFFLCALFSSSVLSRTLEPIPKTSVLDVSVLIQKTVEILSFNPETMQRQQEQESQHQSISSSNTLKLYSRDTLAPIPFKTYRDLTLSRLQRDSARVKFLYKKLYAALEVNKTSDLNSMDFEAPLTSGLSQGFGAYFARFGFGTPPKQLYISIDTGSDITWIQCAPCAYCYEQTDPIFDPSTSSSYKPLTCDTQQCKALRISGCTKNNTCLYGESYGDRSSTVGIFATETLSIGNSISKDIAIGCGLDNEGLFRGAAGIFGLGGDSLSFPSQTKTSSFSYCLVDKDSTSASTLDFDSVVEGVTTPLLRNNKILTFYYVGLTGISVGGQMVPISPSVFAIDPSGNGGVIVDSGTAVTRFPTVVYNALRDEFVKGTKELTATAGFSLFDTCFSVTSNTNTHVPTVEFHFGQKSLSLPPKNYMVMVTKSVVCFAFAPTSETLSIIGNIQQQGIRVTYDLGNSLMGFSPSKC